MLPSLYPLGLFRFILPSLILSNAEANVVTTVTFVVLTSSCYAVPCAPCWGPAQCWRGTGIEREMEVRGRERRTNWRTDGHCFPPPQKPLLLPHWCCFCGCNRRVMEKIDFPLLYRPYRALPADGLERHACNCGRVEHVRLPRSSPQNECWNLLPSAMWAKMDCSDLLYFASFYVYTSFFLFSPLYCTLEFGDVRAAYTQ